MRAAARPVPCSLHQSIPPLHPAAHPLYMCRCVLSQLLCGTRSSALLAAGHTLAQTSAPFYLSAVFTFVRNPWARAISSWKHIHNRGLRPECRRSFARFAELPSSYGAMCLAK